ncbi:Na/H antiporter [Xylariomycetidae sp. FL2044]|nr:Na/H antiporter [Xylariomycetidae sp. FL2044]
MPKLDVSDYNIVLAFSGGFVSLFGLVSYLLKERFSLSEALISLVSGVAFGPHGADYVRPAAYAGPAPFALERLTLGFTRLVLGVQLPSRYLRRELRSVLLLVGPVLAAMWLTTSLLIWALVPALPLLHALAVGACVAPTDPVLSAVVVKGQFADRNVPRDLQQLVVAESGTNDGLGYPFLFFALYLIQQQHATSATGGGGGGGGGAGEAMRLWVLETWGYVILMSVAYGFAVGWLARELLQRAERRGYVDRESFLVFAVSLALFVTGTCGLLGTDDVLACFVAGNVFTWDDWFRRETADDALQPTVDMLLNVAIFVWLGAVCPWESFAGGSSSGSSSSDVVVPLYRLVILGVLVLLLRRLPWVLAAHRLIPQIRETRQALFVGFFGPIGVSAIFYLYVALEFVESLKSEKSRPGDVADLDRLGEVFTVVVWFLSICSIE